jgi:hypothetical protein
MTVALLRETQLEDTAVEGLALRPVALVVVMQREAVERGDERKGTLADDTYLQAERPLVQ